MGCALFVIGPAGSGKTTLTHMLKDHYSAQKRKVTLVNLDPAQALDDLEFAVDIRNHIEITEIMEEADFGPNGGLMAGIEAISDNLDIMEIPEEDDSFLIFDCPGQIELYIHSDSVQKIVAEISKNNSVMIVYALDATHTMDITRFVSASISATIAMGKFEVPHINVFTKCDLVDEEQLDEFIYDMDIEGVAENLPASSEKEKKFNYALTTIIRDQGLLGFVPLNYKKNNSLDALAYQIDTCLQYFDTQLPEE
ncbi:GPN-loop GTPase [Nematocida minor]|uniref:GPN-loop GTPase n=1 Tax=Nematocida minor TaxID=1912983 RepID=UPI00221E4E2C|nr:GPN-loop GTPase [Nematocida minor]KAI5189379.1 GPN-loop GTPase [Nematocida minor]